MGAAKMRLPASLSHAELENAVEKTIGVLGLDLVDIGDGKIGVGIHNAAVEETEVFQLCADEQPVEVVRFVGEQEVAGVFVGRKTVLDQVEALGS